MFTIVLFFIEFTRSVFIPVLIHVLLCVNKTKTFFLVLFEAWLSCTCY